MSEEHAAVVDLHRTGTSTCRSRLLTDPRHIQGMPERERDRAALVSSTFAFRASPYYLDLVDWTDQHDPIRRLIVPTPAELSVDGDLDPSDEAANTVMPGMQHKYADTVLLLATDACGGLCRYCFRKRLFMPGERQTLRDIEAAVDYVAGHPEVRDVLITGGDPLMLSTRRLERIVRPMAAIPHVTTVRIGSKLPAFDPARISSDPELLELLADVGGGGKLYLMTHFDHPNEFTDEARGALELVQSAGVQCLNQCPVTRGINDDADVLAELFQRATDAGTPQYYVFQCRPTAGNEPFRVPIVRVLELLDAARAKVSGLSRRARYCLSHASGKVEVVGADDERIYARYHRARDPRDEGRMLVLKRDDDAAWLDELVPA